jgi:hypothetical protein
MTRAAESDTVSSDVVYLLTNSTLSSPPIITLTRLYSSFLLTTSTFFSLTMTHDVEANTFRFKIEAFS